MSETKVQPTHLRRAAVVYVRQSTVAQVEQNRESTRRQYDLAERARQFGWRTDQITVLDEDLGLSAATTRGRGGFARMTAQVALGHVGILLGLEVSRLARNNADWYRLLDLCGITDTLIGDADGVYDPNVFNDRLILGLKGTMSEAELHVLHARLDGGIRNKAARGELRCGLPVGLVWGKRDGEIRLHPDEAVTGAVGAVFERFAEFGSVLRVWLWFISEKLTFPLRLNHGDAIRWVPPSSPFKVHVTSVLTLKSMASWADSHPKEPAHATRKQTGLAHAHRRATESAPGNCSIGYPALRPACGPASPAPKATNVAVAKRVGVTPHTVGKWRRRFRAAGIEGLRRTPPRSRTSGGGVRCPQEKPDAATHSWGERGHCQEHGTALARPLRGQPHLAQTFKLSTDPEKVRDIAGCTSPRTTRWSCAWTRRFRRSIAPSRFLGYAEGYTHDYVRHGTTTLAALDIATGEVFGQCRKRAPSLASSCVLRLIDREVPAELDIHLVLDNYATHKHAKVKRWLAARPRFHLHFTPTSASWLNQVERWFGLLTSGRSSGVRSAASPIWWTRSKRSSTLTILPPRRSSGSPSRSSTRWRVSRCVFPGQRTSEAPPQTNKHVG